MKVTPSDWAPLSLKSTREQWHPEAIRFQQELMMRCSITSGLPRSPAPIVSQTQLPVRASLFKWSVSEIRKAACLCQSSKAEWACLRNRRILCGSHNSLQISPSMFILHCQVYIKQSWYRYRYCIYTVVFSGGEKKHWHLGLNNNNGSYDILPKQIASL